MIQPCKSKRTGKFLNRYIGKNGRIIASSEPLNRERSLETNAQAMIKAVKTRAKKIKLIR